MANVTVCSMSANAGVLDRPDFNSGKTCWIVRAGAGFNSASGDWKGSMQKSWENSHKIDMTKSSFPSPTGFDVSIAFNKSIKQMPVYWGMELGIANRGYKAEAEWHSGKFSSFGDYIGHHIKQNQSLTAYDIYLTPIMFGYKYELLSNMTIDAHLGGFASVDFAGELKNYEYDWQTSSGHDREKESTHKTNISDISSYRRFDAGLNIGVGFWYGHFNIDFTWQRGFVNVFDFDATMHSQSLKLRLGYAF